MALNVNKYCYQRLLENIPEIQHLQEPLKSEFDALTNVIKNDDYGITILYEDVLCEYFLFLIKHSKQNQDIIKRIVKLIEELVQHESFEVRCIAEVSFIEDLLAKLNDPADVEKYLLPKSLEAAKRIGLDMFGFDWHDGWKKK